MNWIRHLCKIVNTHPPTRHWHSDWHSQAATVTCQHTYTSMPHHFTQVQNAGKPIKPIMVAVRGKHGRLGLAKLPMG